MSDFPATIVPGDINHIPHHELLATLFDLSLTQGVLSARPAAGVARRGYWATDTNQWFRDDGTTWHEISLVEHSGRVGTNVAYLDVNHGNDSNDGLSPGNPKLTFNAAAKLVMLTGGVIVGTAVQVMHPITTDVHFAAPVFVTGLTPEGLYLQRSFTATGRSLTDVVTNSTTTITSATASFTNADVNKLVAIQGAGPNGTTLYTLIASVTNSTTAVLVDAASLTLTGCDAVVGAGTWNRQVADAGMTVNGNTVTSATATFTQADVGRGVYIAGVGRTGRGLYTMITAVASSTTATILATARTTATNQVLIIGCTFGDMLTFHDGGGYADCLFWDSQNTAQIGSPVKVYLDDGGSNGTLLGHFYAQACRHSSNDAVGDWAHAIDMDGSQNDNTGGPGIRRAVFVGEWDFGGNVVGETILINGVVHADFLGGGLFPAPTAVRQGITIKDPFFVATGNRGTANIYFDGFECQGDLNIQGGQEIEFRGGKCGSGTGGVAFVSVGANADKVLVETTKAGGSANPTNPLASTNSLVMWLDGSTNSWNYIGSSGHVVNMGPALALGTNPAQTGPLRLPNNSPIYARNAANSADLAIVSVNASNQVSLDPGALGVAFGGTAVFGNAGTFGNSVVEIAQSGGAATLQVRTATHGTFRITAPNDATAVLLQTQNNTDLTVRANGTGGLTCKGTGSVQIGGAVTTSSTDGFPYVASAAGTPTGVPTALSGYNPMYYDTTNHKLWVYDGSWKGVVVT